jgi:hypothetical protein
MLNMFSVTELLKNAKKYISKINFRNCYIYKKDFIFGNYDYKFERENNILQKKMTLNNISQDSVINGQIIISIPNDIIKNINEVILVSEED